MINDYKLRMIKGWDKNNTPFTMFTLKYIGEKDINLIGESFNSAKIIYTEANHNVSLQTIADVRNYVKYKYIPQLENIAYHNDQVECNNSVPEAADTIQLNNMLNVIGVNGLEDA